MGNREELMAGAKRCLYEKGYGRTTARDIASASGVSLAAIGYHFGSKESLLNLALIEATGEWGDALTRAVTAARASSDDSEQQFAALWDEVLKTFVEHRGLWASQIEAIAQVEHSPELRDELAKVQRMGRLALSAHFQDLDEVPDNETELSRGMFYQALLSGLAVQWLASPDQAPTGQDFLRGLKLVSAAVLKQ